MVVLELESSRSSRTGRETGDCVDVPNPGPQGRYRSVSASPMAEAETTSSYLRWDLGPWPVRERLGALKVRVQSGTGHPTRR